MKKLLFLILLSPLANADMDHICKVKLDFGIATIEEQIESLKCERNNILHLTNYKISHAKKSIDELLLIESNRWCRFDRNRDIKSDMLSCVLYDTKPRTLKE
tara:strand:- start:59 stop:364 length:306 start_codon:yes stop_codon:yes gene_type:complete